MVTTSSMRRLFAGSAMGLLPALICIAGFIMLRLAEHACSSNAYTGEMGHASLILYIAVPVFVTWGFSGVALAVDGHRGLLRSGLVGGLIGGAGLFALFAGMSMRDCFQWGYLDRLLLYSALLIMLLTTPFGVILGWSLSYGIRNLHSFRTVVDSKSRSFAYCGAMPGIAALTWSTLVFALYLIGNADDRGTAGHVFLYILLSISLVAAGGQVGWLIGWLRSRGRPLC